MGYSNLKVIDMGSIRQKILDTLDRVEAQNHALIACLTDRILLTDYAQFVRMKEGCEIWSDALQKALEEHQVVIIPARDTPYYIDRQIVIGSNRRIEAEGASIIQTPDCELLMLRNASTADGTHAPVKGAEQDYNISIFGGHWEESRCQRAGYGISGKYDPQRSFYGVSTLFFFNNMKNLTMEGVTVAHTGGFAVQVGDIQNVVFEKIRFEECYADGLHINGNTTNLICRDVKGQVGDDLVALNAYDWQDSSVNFGPIDTLLCEDLELAPDGRYKAIRILPGRYPYDDGNEADCAIRNGIIRNVQGIKTFKLYYQTPRYRIGGAPERGGVGSADNLFFENISIDLHEPIDTFPDYMNSDPVRGTFSAFELGTDIGQMALENIDLKVDCEKYPLACLVSVGPKSIASDGWEIFDPYVSCKVGKLHLQNIRINGQAAEGTENRIFREISFHDIDRDGHSSGSGFFEEILLDGRKIK